MAQITLFFYGRIRDFLPDKYGLGPISYSFTQKTALKHVIEVFGVPHPEVGKILIEGQDIDIREAVHDGDTIHIYPRLPGEYGADSIVPTFFLDNHLGKLTDYLRLLGFDAAYARDLPDEQIASIASDQGRILLTRDRGLLKRKIVNKGYCVHADEPLDQLAEVVAQFDLQNHVTPFQRCPRCNGVLIHVNKDEILDQLLPLTRQYYNEFTRCSSCGQIYWKGSHYEHMQSLLKVYLPDRSEQR